jgi:hypothetical protein
LRSPIIKKILNNFSHEKDISAIKEKKSKQTWFQRKNVHTERKKGSGIPQGEGEKKTNCLFGIEIKINSGIIL